MKINWMFVFISATVGETENVNEVPMESINAAKSSSEIVRINEILKSAANQSSG